MDRYGHLFPSDMEALATALDEARSRALDHGITTGRNQVAVQLPTR